MNDSQRIRVLLELIGGPQYKAQLDRAALSTKTLGQATALAGKRSVEAARGTFLYGQAIYTLRRYSFYATTGIVALAAEVVKLGFAYNSTRQQARAMLAEGRHPLMTAAQFNRANTALFGIAAATPFNYPQVVHSFQLLYASLRPLGITAGTVENTIRGVTNALALTGRTSPAALGRVTSALQKMAYAGRLTGRTVQQLYQDGIPIYTILSQKLGVTQAQLQNIASLNLAPNKVLAAIINYGTTAPGYAGAAFRSQNLTLGGAFSSFRDFLSQASGGTTFGVFNKLTRFFQAFNAQFYAASKVGKPVTMMQFIETLDKLTTPKTHIIIISFQLLTGVINGFTMALHGATVALDFALKPFDYFFRIIGGGRGGAGSTAKIAGYGIGFMLFAAGVSRAAWAIKTLVSAIRIENAVELSSFLFGRGGKGGIAAVTKGLQGLVKWYKTLFVMESFYEGGSLVVAFKNTGPIARFIRYVAELTKGIRAMAAAWTLEGIAAKLSLTMTVPMMLAWLGIVGAIAAAIYLIIRYHKQITQGLSGQASSVPKSQRNFSNYGNRHGIDAQLVEPWTWHWGDITGKGNRFGIDATKLEPWKWFDTGGIVPGPLGTPVPIIAHGGEVIKANPNYAPRTQNLFDDNNQYLVPVVVQVGNQTLASIVAKTRADKAARA